ncbi:MAG: TetR/AcrR family transcriptional regulator [Lachnospiraceae bacterium]|nr:TetR/AcrR family transcriptional regulator [Lachnospiraceae bacterium]
MPPKAKFTKEQITKEALNIIREEGMESLTARALAKKLGSSACPIFTVFENMEEVQSAVKKAARDLYGEYVKKGLEEVIAFKGVGMQYIGFAMQEPKLFQLLFMSEQPQKPTVVNVLPIIDENYPEILLSIKNSYNMQDNDAEKLYHHLWIYTHGIAVLCATNVCTFTPEQIGKMLTEVCIALLKENKGGSTQ